MVGARGGGGWVGAALASGALLGVAAAGCQTYDFEPVRPVTLAQTTFRTVRYQQTLKPNLLVLADRSGSMAYPVVPTCTGACATRISELRAAMDGFLSTSGTLARMGLVFFPDDSVSACAPAGALDGHPAVALPDPTDSDIGTGPVLEAKASAMKDAIDRVTPNGGTPTAASIAFVGTLPGLADRARKNYVLLMTDGLPNCDATNPNDVCSCGTQSCAREAQCRCTLGTLASGKSACLGSSCAIGCLDQNGATAAIARLNTQGITTIVIGFGADTAGGDARTVLDAMGAAGGFARRCAVDSECGTGNTCDPGTKLCSSRFYQVANGAELTTVLQAIVEAIAPGNVCQFTPNAQPTDARFLAVLVDGQSVEPGPGTWSYSGGSVTFADDSEVCRRIKAASSTDGVDIEIRIVQRL